MAKGIAASSGSHHDMLRLALLTLLLLSTPVWAAPQSFFENSLQGEVPAVFRMLDEPAIEQMFSSAGSRPGVVLSTPDSETRISMTHAQAFLKVEDLEATRAALKARVDSQSSVNWVKDEMISLNGSPWFRLDYDLDVGAGLRRETILGTSLKDRLLFIVISTPIEDQEMLASDLQILIDSLRLVDSSAP